MPKDPDNRRFWSKVSVGDGPCWNWMGSRNGHGYGSIRRDDVLKKAHRFSYEINVGEIPKGLHVLHHCDNPSCVRPSHLFVGTHTDNMRDMFSKNRRNHARGSRCRLTKLTVDDVQLVRRGLREGRSREDIAAEVGTTSANVTNIKLRRSWRWLKEEEPS